MEHAPSQSSAAHAPRADRARANTNLSLQRRWLGEVAGAAVLEPEPRERLVAALLFSWNHHHGPPGTAYDRVRHRPQR